MKNSALVEELDCYIDSPKYEGAFYIDGKWGTGKTHFIKDYKKAIERRLSDKYTPYSMYISLFGLTNISELEKRTIGHRPISNYTCKVLIFDDFERCRIEVQEMFAFINRLINDCSIKVILIGNDEEVVKNLQSNGVFRNKLLASNLANRSDEKDYDKFLKFFSKEPLIYHSIKEKVIARTAKYVFDEDVFFDNIIKEYSSDIQKTLKDSIKIVKEIIRKYQCTNLRTLIAALDYYSTIISRLKKNKKAKLNRLVNKNILVVVFVYMINHKTGKYNFIFNSLVLDQHKIYPMPSIQKYITDLIWDEEELAKEINDVGDEINIQKSRQYPSVLVKLNELWILKTDKELTDEVIEMVKMIENNEMPMKHYFKCLSIVLSFFEYGFEYAIDLEKLLNIMRNNILSSNDAVDVRREIFLSSIDEKYEPYVKRLEKAFGNRNYIASKKDATTILMTLNEESADNILFYESEFRNSRGFLSLVDIDKIFERIKGASSKEVYYFRSCLAAIYSFSNLYEYYSKDLESAIALKELLETYDFSENKIKNKNVSWLINDLTKYIRELHDPSLDF